MTRARLLRTLTITAALAALVGCSAESGPIETSEPAPTPSATPTESLDADVVGDIMLPESCEDVFSAELIERFTSAGEPLNDPSLTMPSVDDPDAVVVLESVPNLRCTWGVASEVGVATTVALVDPDQSAALVETFTAEGFDCGPVADDLAQTRCVLEIIDDGEEGMGGAFGEIEVLRGNVWVATRWVNVDMTGYADDIVASLWS